MVKEIIDLTLTPPPPEYIDIDAVPAASASALTPDASSSAVPESQRKRSRRKKRKRTLTEVESEGTSAAQTREPSVEDGEIDTGKPRERPPHSASEEQVEKSQRRKERRMNEQTQHRRSPSPSPHKSTSLKDADDLFFIDIAPAPLPPSAFFPSSSTAPAQEKPDSALLLPAHVSVFGNEPVEIMAPTTPDSDEEDYINYLDYDDRANNVTRYFHEPEKESEKLSRTVCKNCKAEGEHTTAQCPVMICLTCGARDEHGTRSCPISKTCFTCGMKGHINATCPNRRAARRGELDKYNDCDRCGSETHKANECPTLWRLYEYLSDEAKKHVLRTRKQKQKLSVGEGGEGYIADDEWCYNCGGCGHWGDDCQDLPHREDAPNEFSAFSEHNTFSGPFSDRGDRPEIKKQSRKPRDWELGNDLPPTWGKVPENVGRQGRRNNAAKLEQRAQEQAAKNDFDDWFDNMKNPLRGLDGNHPSASGAPKKITFGKSIQESSRHFQPPPPPPTLLERLSNSHGDSGESRSRRHDSRTPRKNDRDERYSSDRSRDRHRDRDRDRDRRRRDDPGPRYKGGYSR